MPIHRTLCAVAGAAALLLAACSPAGPGTGPTDGAKLQRPRVVVAFYPLQFLTERIAGDLVEVTTLTQPGAEPHDLELTPQQVASLAEATLVVYQQGFQPAVDEAVAQSGAQNVLETTSVVPLQPVSVPHTDNEDEFTETPEEDAEPAEEHAEDHDHEGGLDPHVWLDPTNMIDLSKAVADRLSALDQANAATYAANRQALVTELADLDADFTDGLADCEIREFITTHDAFGYLARRYKLIQIPIGGLSANTEPSANRIAEVQVEVMEHALTTIFYETLVSPTVATTLAKDLGVKTDVLDPAEGITPESKGQDYLSVMRANLASLRAANACP